MASAEKKHVIEYFRRILNKTHQVRSGSFIRALPVAVDETRASSDQRSTVVPGVTVQYLLQEALVWAGC